MMQTLIRILAVTAALGAWQTAAAQQSQDFGPFVVHYNALNTSMLPPAVAKGYGIQRSSNRALLNVTVLRKVMDNPGSPAKAAVTATATNLTGQRRTIEIREISENDGATYYIGEFPVHHLETWNFAIEVTPEGETEPLVVKFRQQFYTE